MTFRIGQEVECIARVGRWVPQNHAGPAEPGPEIGDVLGINAIDIDEVTGETYLIFATWRGSYFAECFRPVVRTDISIFLAMLNKAPKRARKRSQVTA